MTEGERRYATALNSIERRARQQQAPVLPPQMPGESALEYAIRISTMNK
jgi:hypothetical protein